MVAAFKDVCSGGYPDVTMIVVVRTSNCIIAAERGNITEGCLRWRLAFACLERKLECLRWDRVFTIAASELLA